MRSDLVFTAMTHVSNRYLLVKLAAKATREFHRPNTFVKDTLNDVLFRFGRTNPIPISTIEPSPEFMDHRAAA